MKKFRPLLILLIMLGVFTAPVFSQVKCNLLQANNATTETHLYAAGYWFGVMELPLWPGACPVLGFIPFTRPVRGHS